MNTEEEKLRQQFKAETGKNVIWRGNLTKGYLDWKQKKTRKKIQRMTNKKNSKSFTSRRSSGEMQLIFSKFEDFEKRLRALEDTIFHSKGRRKNEPINEEQFLRILKNVYISLDKKFGDFVSISSLTNEIKEYLPLSTRQIHEELYRLFMEYKIDLQPGKQDDGIPLKQDGKTFVWFKFKKI